MGRVFSECEQGMEYTDKDVFMEGQIEFEAVALVLAVKIIMQVMGDIYPAPQSAPISLNVEYTSPTYTSLRLSVSAVSSSEHNLLMID